MERRVCRVVVVVMVCVKFRVCFRQSAAAAGPEKQGSEEALYTVRQCMMCHVTLCVCGYLYCWQGVVGPVGRELQEYDAGFWEE